MNKVESALQRTTDTKALVIGVGTLPRTAEMFNELFPGCLSSARQRMEFIDCTHNI